VACASTSLLCPKKGHRCDITSVKQTRASRAWKTICGLPRKNSGWIGVAHVSNVERAHGYAKELWSLFADRNKGYNIEAGSLPVGGHHPVNKNNRHRRLAEFIKKGGCSVTRGLPIKETDKGYRETGIFRQYPTPTHASR